MKIVGIDIGYGFLKVRNNGCVFVVPSVVGSAVDLSFKLKEDTKNVNLSNLKIKVDGVNYFVGDLAILQAENSYRSLTSDRTTDTASKVLFLAGLCLTTPEAVEDFFIVTGLPVLDFSLLKDSYVENFVGIHKVEFNGVFRVINIKKIVVVPQPYGTYCSLLFKETGEVDEEFADSHVGVIDIGYKTSDFIQVKEFNYLDKFSSSSQYGISVVYKDISNYLGTKHGLHKEDYELEKIIKDEYIKTRSGVIDLSAEIAKSKKSLANKICNEVLSVWKNSAEISNIIISGGGSAFLEKELKELLGDDIILIENSQTANAEGYEEWGVYLGSED